LAEDAGLLRRSVVEMKALPDEKAVAAMERLVESLRGL
jgi:hypothetical protein